jgi:hypothetical protein
VTTVVQNGTTRTRRTQGGAVVVTTKPGEVMIGGPITIKEGKTPCEQGINLSGKTFTFAYYGSSWNDNHKKWFKEFEAKYGLKFDVRGVATEEYVAALSAAIAGGTPYDVVFLHSFNYPSQMTANTMVPLND